MPTRRSIRSHRVAVAALVAAFLPMSVLVVPSSSSAASAASGAAPTSIVAPPSTTPAAPAAPNYVSIDPGNGKGEPSISSTPVAQSSGQIQDNGTTSEGTAGGWTYGIGPDTTPAGTANGGVLGASTPNSAASVVAITNQNVDGYWEAASDGGVYSFGTINFYGSRFGLQSSADPITGMTVTPDHDGYWLYSVGGYVYPFGDAANDGGVNGGSGGPDFVGLVSNTGNTGYWQISATGSVYQLGSVSQFGGLPSLGQSVNDVVAAAPYEGGYCMIEATRRVSCFTGVGQHTQFYIGNTHFNIYDNPVTSLASSDRTGLWATDRTGQVYTYGSAIYGGGISGTPSAPVMSISGIGTGGYRLGLADGSVFDNMYVPFEGNVSVGSELATTDAAEVGHVMLPQGDWGNVSEWNALNSLWGTYESGWQWSASNPSPCDSNGDTAYGIPQSCPGSKMAASGPNWQTNAWTQIMWGYLYIGTTYTDPIGALNQELHGCGSPPCGYIVSGPPV